MITPDFSAYAIGIDAHFSSPQTSSEVQRIVENLLTKITLACVEAGADLIGHIKSVAETEGNGFLASSVTEPTGMVRSRGELKDGIDEVELTVNVLLYGLERSKVSSIVQDIAEREMRGKGVHIHMHDLEKEHEHDHDHEHGHDH